MTNPFESSFLEKPLKEKEEAERREVIQTAVMAEIDKEMKQLHRGEPFHNEEHSKKVATDANEILDIFERHGAIVTKKDRLAAETAAKGHDLIINYSIETNPAAFNFGQRVRHRGFGEFMPSNIRSRSEVVEIDGVKKGNEELSFLRLKEIIAKYDPQGEIYTPEVMGKIKESIASTYPDVKPVAVPEKYQTVRDTTTGETVNLNKYLGQDKEGRPIVSLFNQPLLKPESSAVAVAVSFGDLLYAGKNSFESFRQRSNGEYREIHEVFSAMISGKESLELKRLLREGDLPESIGKEISGGWLSLSPQRKAEIAKSAVNWVDSQVGFLLGQKIRFDNILENLDIIKENQDRPGLVAELSKTYSNFDPNIIESTKRADTVRQKFGDLMNEKTFISLPDDANKRFKKLMEEMGYELK